MQKKYAEVNTRYDAPVVVGSEDPDSVIIWLHGLGADGHDFVPIVSALNLGSNVQFIFPHAAVQPVTLNGGMACRSWFDIRELKEPTHEDIEGMNDTDAYVQSLIAAQLARGIAGTRIFLAGFSQGGAMALYSGLRCETALGGILGLSTMLAGSVPLETERSQANQQTPLFLAHGTADNVLPYSLGLASYKKLLDWGYKVSWHEYAMGHEVSPQQVRDIAQFLKTLYL